MRISRATSRERFEIQALHRGNVVSANLHESSSGQPISALGVYINPMMLRRFAPFLAVLFAANISAQAAGAECVMPQARTDSTMPSGPSAMAGMNPAADDATLTTTHSGEQSPCGVPVIPASCTSFAPCGTAVLGLSPEIFAIAKLASFSPPVAVFLVPESPPVAPELPPPRA